MTKKIDQRTKKAKNHKTELCCFVPNIWFNLHLVNFDALNLSYCLPSELFLSSFSLICISFNSSISFFLSFFLSFSLSIYVFVWYLVAHSLGCFSIFECTQEVLDDLELAPEQGVLAHVHLKNKNRMRYCKYIPLCRIRVLTSVWKSVVTLPCCLK